jgi:hypothetical protein
MVEIHEKARLILGLVCQFWVFESYREKLQILGGVRSVVPHTPQNLGLYRGNFQRTSIFQGANIRFCNE